MGVNMNLVNRILENQGKQYPGISEVGNPAIEVGELKKVVKKQNERINELETMVIKLFNMVQRDIINM